MKSSEKSKKSDRREFIRNSLALGTTALVGAGCAGGCSAPEAEGSGEKVKVMTTEGKLMEIDPAHLHHLTHNQVSSEEARKGDPNKEYVMVIDLAKCRHARKCVEECQRMHFLPPEDEWMKVFLMKDSEDTSSYWFPKPCFHCNSPSCVNVCPVGATFKRLDGLVLIDNERCIGCKFCMAACPYSSRVFQWKEPEYNPAENVEFSPESSVPHQMGTVGKCDFCPDMARMGKLPVCVTACPNGVLYYGDRKEDAVTNGVETVRFSELIYEKAGYRYMEELGTNPSVYYLPPVNRLFHPETGFNNLSDEVIKRYEVARSKIKKEIKR